MKEKVIKTLKYLLLGFLALFLSRWFFLLMETKKHPGVIYSSTYTSTDSGFSLFPMFEMGSVSEDNDGSFGSMLIKSREGNYHNYTREESFSQQEPTLGAAPPPHQEATYEKVASLGALSRDFDNDNQKVRASIQSHKALIQQEDNSGLKGARQLTLTLGVVPDRFEALVEELKKVGTLEAFELTKADKTSDYQALRAKRASLEKQRADLEALKHVGGKMADLLALQQKIFDIGNELQGLGVEIGHFEGEAGLCTVVFAMRESGPGPGFLELGEAAFFWALWLYLRVLFFLFFSAIILYLLIRFYEKTLGLPQVWAAGLPKTRRSKGRGK